MNPARADLSRRIGCFTATSLLIFILIVSVALPVNITFSSQTTEGEQFPQTIIASSSTDTTPHFLNLKATQQGDAEPQRVSGFNLDTTNTVVAQRNSQLQIFVTDSSLDVIEAKVRTVSDELIDLVPSIQENAFSLANLPAGVYTLDVITQKGNAKAAYEGILVPGQEPTSTQTKTIIERQVIREEQDNGDNGYDGDCDPSYPDDCIPSPPPDLDCGDNGVPNDFKVRGSDPHGFDRDNDSIGCESNSSNGGNNGDDNEDEDGRGECIEDNGYSLSEGSYIDEDNNAIVGSPCDPEEFCEDESSTDPVVIDFCDDTWDDVDEEPPEECPPGTTGTPPDCFPICPEGEECPPDECPPGTIGTPPDCEPIPPPDGELPPALLPDEQPPDEGDTNGSSDEENGDTDESEVEDEGDGGGDEGDGGGDEEGESAE